MSPASHAVGRLRDLYGIVLGRMRALNERSMHPPLGRSESAPPAILEHLEPRLLLSGTVEEQALELFSVSPALFVENQGQWADETVRYVHQGSGKSRTGEPVPPGTGGRCYPSRPLAKDLRRLAGVTCPWYRARTRKMIADLIPLVGRRRAHGVRCRQVGSGG